MKLYFLVPIMLSLSGLSSYRQNINKRSIDDANSKKLIVLIFLKNKVANDAKKGTFYTSNNVRYYDKSLIRIDRELKNKVKNDTILIRPEKALLPIDLFHNYVTYNYYFQPGDTAVFTFDKDVPLITYLNRQTRPYDLNYSLYYKLRFNKPLKADNILRLSVDKTPLKEQFNNLYKGYLKQGDFLDSLQKGNLITPYLKQAYDTQNRYEFFNAVLFNPNYKLFLTDLLKQYPLAAQINEECLLYNDYYHDFLVWHYLWGDAFNIKKIQNGHGISLDYKLAYDKVKTVFTNQKVQHYMQFYCLTMIQEEDSFANFRFYESKFRSEVKDTTFAGYLDKNSTGASVNDGVSSIIINLSKQNKMEYTQLIKQSANKVILVDLWASWCLPCRAAMPASRQLKDYYKNKPVNFVYLSIDSKYTAWKKASEEENLSAYNNNYLLLNPKLTGLIKQIDLKTIPRYLIYNKKGELVFANAPGPDSPELKKLIDKYLAD